MTKSHNIEVLPQGRQIKGRDGKSLMEALVDSSIFLRSDCGGSGRCGKCRVKKISIYGEKESITSCNSEVKESLKIEIPESSMLSSHIISKALLSFPPTFLKQKRTEDIEESYGIAVDLGTTTIAVYLCNRSQGAVLSSLAIKNPQALYGDDVMSRIGAIGKDQSNLVRLQRIVVNAIKWGSIELLRSHSLAKEDISQIVVVGNPTMIHILSGVDPEPIGLSPYLPAFHEARIVASETVGFELGDSKLLTLPQISGFIGGDILGAALATDLENQPDGTLLIDLGTNGELLFKAGDRFFATSCATGPAFEGASLTCGTQAIPGAINKIFINKRTDYPNYTTINSVKKKQPTGLCGTGVISSIAELWRSEIIDSGGAFIKDDSIRPLQRNAEARLQYTIVKANGTKGTDSVFISQEDVRSVQLGKAALRTGIDFLIRAAGYDEPTKIIIAGAFGAYVDKTDMLAIGMIPKFDPEKIETAGNSAGAGAVMVLSDNHYLTKNVTMAEKTTIVDLATDISFQSEFVKNLSFPH
ncbi:MAG: ASKHA domain-containing protein [Desulforhopalus sp.]